MYVENSALYRIRLWLFLIFKNYSILNKEKLFERFFLFFFTFWEIKYDDVTGQKTVAHMKEVTIWFMYSILIKYLLASWTFLFCFSHQPCLKATQVLQLSRSEIQYLNTAIQHYPGFQNINDICILSNGQLKYVAVAMTTTSKLLSSWLTYLAEVQRIERAWKI